MTFREYLLNKSICITSPFVINESKGVSGAIINKHLDHLDEIVLIYKKEGFDRAVEVIQDIRELLNGSSKVKLYTTIKFDGAPALTFGIDKETNQPFVATKSIFNKDAKINYSDKDIQNNHGHAPGLMSKLKIALQYVPRILKPGNYNIYQGDMMYTKDSLFYTNFNGERLLAYKPNTITYAVEEDSGIAHDILESQLGLVVHTQYTGEWVYTDIDTGKVTTKRPTNGANVVKSFNPKSTSFRVDTNDFNYSSDVWVMDAKFSDYSGNVTLTPVEESHIDDKLLFLTSTKLDWDTIPDDIFSTVKVFANTQIKTAGSLFDDINTSYNNYILYIRNMFDKQISSVKTQSSKEKKQNSRDSFIDDIERNEIGIKTLFRFVRYIGDIKQVYIDKYNNIIKTRQFLEDENGDLRVTAPEGYVAIDRKGNAVKLVDRLEFSKANFSKPKAQKFT